MFGFLKKAKIGKTEEEKRAESLPMTKKVQFEPLTIVETEQQLEQDIRAVLGFTPVNYYATKNRYLLCTFFYAEDFSEVFMRFELRVDDLPRGHSRMYSIDKVLLRDILRKCKYGKDHNTGLPGMVRQDKHAGYALPGGRTRVSLPEQNGRIDRRGFRLGA